MMKVFRDRYGAMSKLDDCTASGRGSGAELFVVEGDSAASAVARVRDPRQQAVLPMQGKPLNAVRAPRAKVESHPFFGPLAAALGTGVEAACDPRRLRYDRVLVLTDPDADPRRPPPCCRSRSPPRPAAAPRRAASPRR